MDRIISEILANGFTQIDETLYQKIKISYVLDLRIEKLSDKCILFHLSRTYKNGEKIIIYNQKRKISKLLYGNKRSVM